MIVSRSRVKNRESFLKEVRTVAVIGAGVSGISAVKLAEKFGKRVKLSDSNPDVLSSIHNLLSVSQVEIETGKHSPDFFKDADLVVLSPGINALSFKKDFLSGNKSPCIGEMEFASWFCKSGDIIAVTGTNGKTTVSYLLGKILETYSGRPVYTLGNIGKPLSSSVRDIEENSIVVIEASSFQLETVASFRPFVSVFLNFAEDHLDRHSSIDEYFRCKKNIFSNQLGSDLAVIPLSLENRLKDIAAKKIVVKENSNFSAIEAAAGIYNIRKDKVREYLSGFKGLPHRMERVSVKKGVSFINDSKSTNVLSTQFALNSISSQVLLIAGGRDKGLDYSLINPCLGKVKKILLIGEARTKIKKSLQGFVDIEENSSIEDAVYSAYKQAEEGDAVLLSPMCSSFDMFRNYQDRGDAFRNAVYKL